ncbi:hypothetical protein M409DRAFT_69469 [Zasmidium cellare ATCC 36951]|uniref:Uncharacterized protein n=1 Tax=Zasmidium cellare ATCC 36951 TaxID=1080233 RepID=A0A6A6C4W8_ZASCE|nr:uncharacterized protein M409DRAFT_69469 [Zasmidium cellare ATCC 36951]KAF2161963.1 hypothetical protein M409DRAFT_69469 [Zasmidium cellare ATCC 36951]
MATQKTAYVTGGASGIGRAVVEMLVRRGVRVAIADVNLQGAQSLASTLQGALAVELNAADWDSQLAAFKQILQQFGRIDYVYGIAGVGERTWIPNDPNGLDFTKPDLTTLDIDLNGVLYTSALAIQQMRRQDPDERGIRGKITVVASVCGFYCVPTLPIYTAAKHGVVGFVRSFGKHLPTDGITLNAICPDVVRTNISTSGFYDALEERKLLVSMESVMEAFERCLDTEISGETLEIEPNSGITHRSPPEPIDQDAAETMKLLHQRGASYHAPNKFK